LSMKRPLSRQWQPDNAALLSPLQIPIHIDRADELDGLSPPHPAEKHRRGSV
jgi:hypothetical protein